MGPLIPLFWSSGDISSRFPSQSGQPYSHLAEAYVLHVLWDSPLVWHLPTSWWPAWQLSCSLPHTCKQALVGLKTRIYCAVDECSTEWAMSARLLVSFVIFITRDSQVWWKMLPYFLINYHVLKELICQDKYKKIQLKLKHKNARSANNANLV